MAKAIKTEIKLDDKVVAASGAVCIEYLTAKGERDSATETIRKGQAERTMCDGMVKVFTNGGAGAGINDDEMVRAHVRAALVAASVKVFKGEPDRQYTDDKDKGAGIPPASTVSNIMSLIELGRSKLYDPTQKSVDDFVKWCEKHGLAYGSRQKVLKGFAVLVKRGVKPNVENVKGYMGYGTDDNGNASDDVGITLRADRTKDSTAVFEGAAAAADPVEEYLDRISRLQRDLLADKVPVQKAMDTLRDLITATLGNPIRSAAPQSGAPMDTDEILANPKAKALKARADKIKGGK